MTIATTITTMTTQPFTLIDQWFAQLDQRVLNKPLTRQVAQLFEEAGGFARLAHWMQRPSAAASETNTVASAVGKAITSLTQHIQVLVATLLPQDLTPDLCLRGTGAQSTTWSVASKPGWKLTLTIAPDSVSMSLTGELVIPGLLDLSGAQAHLFQDDQLLETQPLDKFGYFVFHSLKTGRYEVRVEFDQIQVRVEPVEIN